MTAAWLLLAAVASLLAGGIAAVRGFGIGSLLTPLLAAVTDTRLAVAAVSIPHAAGTALRLWILRAASMAGVVAGTLAGGGVLQRARESTFRRLVSSVLLLLGLVTLVRWAAG